MEQLRRHYEMRMGRRVADSHWWKVRKILENANIELTETNLDHYLEIRKLCPRYSVNFKILLQRIKAFNEYLGSKKQMTGLHFCYYLKSQNVKPHQATISRWFSPVGGFKKDRVYSLKELSTIAIPAFSYQIKNEVSNNA